MLAIEKSNHDEVMGVAQNMGFDRKKPAELTACIDKISKMDQWDIAKIRFFGNRYVKKQGKELHKPRDKKL